MSTVVSGGHAYSSLHIKYVRKYVDNFGTNFTCPALVVHYMSASKFKEYLQVRHVVSLHDTRYYANRNFCQMYYSIFCQNHKINKINIGIPCRNFAPHHFFNGIHWKFRLRSWGGLQCQNIHTVVRENRLQH